MLPRLCAQRLGDQGIVHADVPQLCGCAVVCAALRRKANLFSNDQDSKVGADVVLIVKAMGSQPLPTAFRSR